MLFDKEIKTHTGIMEGVYEFIMSVQDGVTTMKNLVVVLKVTE
jgi:hypothetical protein